MGPGSSPAEHAAKHWIGTDGRSRTCGDAVLETAALPLSYTGIGTCTWDRTTAAPVTAERSATELCRQISLGSAPMNIGRCQKLVAEGGFEPPADGAYE